MLVISWFFCVYLVDATFTFPLEVSSSAVCFPTVLKVGDPVLCTITVYNTTGLQGDESDACNLVIGLCNATEGRNSEFKNATFVSTGIYEMFLFPQLVAGSAVTISKYVRRTDSDNVVFTGGTAFLSISPGRPDAVQSTSHCQMLSLLSSARWCATTYRDSYGNPIRRCNVTITAEDFTTDQVCVEL